MTRDLLAIILAKHRDQVLTTDVARQILTDVDIDHSIDTTVFEPEKVGLYSLQCERVAGIESQLDPLHRAYLAATQPHLDAVDFPYGPLRAAERAGTVLQATARVSSTGELVGLMRVRVCRRSDSSVLSLTDDLFYIRPEHRVSMLASRLWRYCERAAFRLGVREATITTLTVTESMARYFGYRKVATSFIKVAPNDAHDYFEVTTRHKEEANDSIF